MPLAVPHPLHAIWYDKLLTAVPHVSVYRRGIENPQPFETCCYLAYTMICTMWYYIILYHTRFCFYYDAPPRWFNSEPRNCRGRCRILQGTLSCKFNRPKMRERELAISVQIEEQLGRLNPWRDKHEGTYWGGVGGHLWPRFIQEISEGKTSHDLSWEVKSDDY